MNKHTTKEPFQIFPDQKIFDGKYLSIYETPFVDKNGEGQVWQWTAGHQAAVIFPITRDRKVVLIKNFRIPFRQYVIELPAGAQDKPDESLLSVAHRELLEETGYRAEHMVQITPPWPSIPSHSGTTCTAFAAFGLTKERHTCGDGTEDISVIEVPIDLLPGFYCSLPPSQLIDPRILGFYTIVKHLKIA